jgi:hypothetical protein
MNPLCSLCFYSQDSCHSCPHKPCFCFCWWQSVFVLLPMKHRWHQEVSWAGWGGAALGMKDKIRSWCCSILHERERLWKIYVKVGDYYLRLHSFPCWRKKIYSYWKQDWRESCFPMVTSVIFLVCLVLLEQNTRGWVIYKEKRFI